MLKRLGNISFQVMNATELQCDDKFDVVFSNSVFHWIKQQEEEGALLKDKIIKLIERDNGENGIKFNFHRLYVYASR